MRGKAAAGALAIALWLGPSAAQACTISVDSVVMNDPDDVGLSRSEKARREAAWQVRLEREGREEMRRWQAEARRGLAGGAPAYAEALVDSLVPPPVTIGRSPCSQGESIYSRHDHYDQARAAIEAAAGNSPRLILGEFNAGYVSKVRGCDAEMRQRLGDYLGARMGEAALARIWTELHRFGFDYSGKGTGHSLYYLPRESASGLRLQSSAETTGEGGSIFSHRLYSDAHEQRSERNWARMSRFLSRDPEVQQLIAVLDAGLAELSDPAQPYGGLCPDTTQALEAFVASAVESAKPLKPRVEVLFDDPPAAGS